MEATFVELTQFLRHRDRYLSDEDYRALQILLLQCPTLGDVIPSTRGLRKIRFRDSYRISGKRGGLRIIYYWLEKNSQIIMVTLYSKADGDDLAKRDYHRLGVHIQNILKEIDEAKHLR